MNKILIVILLFLLVFNLYFLNVLRNRSQTLPLPSVSSLSEEIDPFSDTPYEGAVDMSDYNNAEKIYEQYRKNAGNLFNGQSLPFEFPPRKYPFKIPVENMKDNLLIRDSGQIVKSLFTASPPKTDGLPGNNYSPGTRLESVFYKDLTVSALHDNANLYFLISFSVKRQTQLFFFRKEWMKKAGIYHIGDFSEEKFWNPWSYLFMDLYWEFNQGDIEKCMQNKQNISFDLWQWTPATSLGTHIEDNMVRALSELSPNDVVFVNGELFNPLPVRFSPNFLVFGSMESDWGNKPFSLDSWHPPKYEGDCLNCFAANHPTGSSADISGSWSFNGKTMDLDGAAKAGGIGEWVIELSRRLDTGNTDDVRFDSLSGQKYRFFLPFITTFYSNELEKQGVYSREMLDQIGKLFPYYSLEFVKQ
ncbi:MAG: hypothetical protein PHQ23_00395 [Candidatus Wallbacteria bacterium]|nr:hypothetical protein [Candidatus Wallbacteria bacterium]